MDDDDFQQPAYPPSVLFGGAALLAVLGGIVASVLMVSAASVDVHRVPPAPRSQPAAHPASPAPVRPAPPAESGAQNSLELLVDRLVPQLPGLDQLLQTP
ncbi:hypothetical protein [Mycolicibacterium aichiense]|uniref:Uncharacterized protein n=1 Tax=Mycolicibacterium aichiense TaxID=1799 RepID=A0AAD1MDN9_9MYCO|nr:hypothetical protein [Mycolicibacterium aichiense]MCV7016428.1 hypothetical protein [Mycolicibacterium aichiense]BBX09798.1 hypothetical protein MAIC_46010 [Mycolicibacterium aichiense]SUA14361.1 Uncharacterised protein [Mycolicibacterium aichiense]